MTFIYKDTSFDLEGTIENHIEWIIRHVAIPKRQKMQAQEGWPSNCILHYARLRVKLQQRKRRQELNLVATWLERSEE